MVRAVLQLARDDQIGAVIEGVRLFLVGVAAAGSQGERIGEGVLTVHEGGRALRREGVVLIEVRQDDRERWQRYVTAEMRVVLITVRTRGPVQL